MISIIIPTLDEARALPVTLAALRGQAGDYEVLVVDGGSSDATRDVAGRCPGVRVLLSTRGRGAQMNTGARQARGELLLFLHADTQLPDNAISMLNALEGDPDFAWGGFHHRFSGRHPALRFISRLHNKRCALTGVFYGDQAMVVRRSLFAQAGGFATGLLEDIRLSETLLQRRQPRFLEATVVTDSRKFEQMGPWRSLARCLLILACHELRLPIRGRAFFAPIR